MAASFKCTAVIFRCAWTERGPGCSSWAGNRDSLVDSLHREVGRWAVLMATGIDIATRKHGFIRTIFGREIGGVA